MSRNIYYVKSCALHHDLPCEYRHQKSDPCPPGVQHVCGGMSRKIISTFAGEKHER